MLINDEFRIRRLNKDNYVVENKRIAKEGKIKGQEVWDILGYYSCAINACKGATKHIANDVCDTSTNLAQFLVEMETVTWEMTRKIKELIDD